MNITEQPSDENDRNRAWGFITASCRSGTKIARRIAAELDLLIQDQKMQLPHCFLPDIDYQFPDSETCAELTVNPCGADVFLIQALFDPSSQRTVDENYMALLIAASTFKEYGARRVIAVLPHLAYIRQDKPSKLKRQPTTARLIATLSRTAGIDEFITWHFNSDLVCELYSATPLTILNPVELFAEAFSIYRSRPDTIVIAPDQTAIGYASQLAQSLGVSFGYAVKERVSPTTVKIQEIVMDCGDYRTVILFDDLIASAGTLRELVQHLSKRMPVRSVIAGASHAVCTGRALERLHDMHQRCGLDRVVVTNSIPQADLFRSLGFVEELCIVKPLARNMLSIIDREVISAVIADPSADARQLLDNAVVQSNQLLKEQSPK